MPSNLRKCRTASTIPTDVAPYQGALFLLPLVGSDQLDVLDEMALHRLLELRLGGILQILKPDIERIELEEIAMSTDRGARAAVGLLSEIVGAMPRLRRQHWPRRIHGEFPHDRRNIVDDPVDEDTLRLGGIRRIRIVHYERQAFRIARHVGPGQRRREIFAIAGILGWNRSVVSKCRGNELERRLAPGRHSWKNMGGKGEEREAG